LASSAWSIRFLSSDAFVRLALQDELELTADGRAAGRSIRVGYLVVRSDSPEVQEILATPQLLDDERVQQQQEDLALVLILATLAGLVAAVYLAGLTARGLARPVAALRDAAGAVGRGAPLPSFPPGAPREFEPVISAFERMAADVTRSQGALEEARRRTPKVLANVATGVIAVDDGLRVTMANPRAAELLGAPLTPGDLLTGAARRNGSWSGPAVREYPTARPRVSWSREFAWGGARSACSSPPWDRAPDGCVVALDARPRLPRARVLAWGEMARQVAHEIKNPLTRFAWASSTSSARARRKDGRDFDATLAETARAILPKSTGWTRLRGRSPPLGVAAAEALRSSPSTSMALAREVVHLYSLGGAEAEATVAPRG